MQFKKSFLSACFFIIINNCFSQHNYLPTGDKLYHILDRMEIMASTDSVLNFSKTKPFSRKGYIYNGTKSFEAPRPGTRSSKQDKYNLNSIYQNNIEQLPEEERAGYLLKKRAGKTFFKNSANLFQVLDKDFNCVVNPVLQLTATKENDNAQRLFLNTRGLQIRGNIAGRVGFYTMVSDNQERSPSYVQQWQTTYSAVPGAGNFKEFKAAGGTDYFDARGYINFKAAKFIEVVFGYDKNFIGNGYRSLFLSDFGNNNLFLKLNTRIWKINYQNLFMELTNAESRRGDRLLGKKYTALHHLDIGITKWLNLGFFESVIFGRTNRFEFSYLNPVIFLRSIELQNGSPDNVLLGGDFKANIAKRFQLYGQLLLDEFSLKHVKANDGWWANKWGLQLGAKYINAFGIKNLDLQAEKNFVRPFTYSHTDSVANYTHYNQPMAHPLMANFNETVGIIRYQPISKLYLTGRVIAYYQGRDTGSLSFGSNIFLPNKPANRNGDYGYFIGNGWKTNVAQLSLLASYEITQNLFAEVYVTSRREKATTQPTRQANTTTGTLGIRWNIPHREFDF